MRTNRRLSTAVLSAICFCAVIPWAGSGLVRADVAAARNCSHTRLWPRAPFPHHAARSGPRKRPWLMHVYSCTGYYVIVGARCTSTVAALCARQGRHASSTLTSRWCLARARCCDTLIEHSRTPFAACIMSTVAPLLQPESDTAKLGRAAGMIKIYTCSAARQGPSAGVSHPDHDRVSRGRPLGPARRRQQTMVYDVVQSLAVLRRRCRRLHAKLLHPRRSPKRTMAVQCS
jgi:hypothetical protein